MCELIIMNLKILGKQVTIMVVNQSLSLWSHWQVFAEPGQKLITIAKEIKESIRKVELKNLIGSIFFDIFCKRTHINTHTKCKVIDPAQQC